MPTAAAAPPAAVVTAFARALRGVGVAADVGRVLAAVDALGHVDALDLDQVYWATRLTLCSEPDDLPRFDGLFATWFGAGGSQGAPPTVPAQAPTQALTVTQPAGAPAAEPAPDEDGPVEAAGRTAAASDLELLAHRDLPGLSASERVEVQRMIALLTPRPALRRTLRRRPGGRRELDVGRTVRAMLRAGGEPVALAHRQRRQRPRRLVLLLDVSGSMTPYAPALLRFAHAAVRVRPAHTEVFTLGTRLTRITRPLRLRDAEAALAAAGAVVPDWSGGTRLGESLQVFLDRWGQRGAARGAVVVVASDGWERGDAALLGDQTARLARLAHAVVWVNPHRGKAGFAPQTAGMVAVLPHLDALVAGHSFAALRDLVEVIRRA